MICKNWMLVWTGSIVLEGPPGDVAADLAPSNLPLEEFVLKTTAVCAISCRYAHGYVALTYQ